MLQTLARIDTIALKIDPCQCSSYRWLDDQLYLRWIPINGLPIKDRGSHIIDCTLDKYQWILLILDTSVHMQAWAKMST